MLDAERTTSSGGVSGEEKHKRGTSVVGKRKSISYFGAPWEEKKKKTRFEIQEKRKVKRMSLCRKKAGEMIGEKNVWARDEQQRKSREKRKSTVW